MKSEIKALWRKYYRNMMSSLEDEYFQKGLRRTIESYRSGIIKLLENFPEVLDLANEVRKIKEYSIEHIDELLEKAETNLKINGAKVYFADTADDARRIVREIVGDVGVIVKSKSITSEEIWLRDFLIEGGYDV